MLPISKGIRSNKWQNEGYNIGVIYTETDRHDLSDTNIYALAYKTDKEYKAFYIEDYNYNLCFSYGFHSRY